MPEPIQMKPRSLIAGVTTCNLCKQKFTAPAAGLILSANGPLQEYLLALAKHFIDKHPNENAALELNAAAYLGCLRMLNYHTTDAELAEQRDALRWQVHQTTLAGRISDQTIRSKCRELAEQALQPIAELYSEDPRKKMLTELEAKLVILITWFRDELEETGKYPSVSNGNRLKPA